MASTAPDARGFQRIFFYDKNRKRRCICLGTLPVKSVESIKIKVRALNAAAITGDLVDDETNRWLAQISDDLRAKLVAVGLANPGGRALCLGKFLENYIDGRKDVKPRTRTNLMDCRARLTDYFGVDRDLRTITAGDADGWLVYLRAQARKGRGYASATIGRTVKRAKQFFEHAVRKEWLRTNPFRGLKAPGQANKDRGYFVSPAITRRVIDACPDAEWRLIVALCRYGGLRCPSELGCLEWTHFDWEHDRFLVHSPKNEHHKDGGDRWVPIFPELRPYLRESFELAPEGAVHVVPRCRDGNVNLRTRFLRIIQRAGLLPWPRLFHNLRGSRETELAGEFPIHVVCSWIGNTELIAAKHYLRVTEDDFARATGKGLVSRAAAASNAQAAAPKKKTPEKPGSSRTQRAASRTEDQADTPKGTRTTGLKPYETATTVPWQRYYHRKHGLGDAYSTAQLSRFLPPPVHFLFERTSFCPRESFPKMDSCHSISANVRAGVRQLWK